MDNVGEIAKAFMRLFKVGGKQFADWVGTIIPTILMLLVLMNAIIAFVGKKRMDKFAHLASRNIFTRYLVLPFLAAFMLTNPMCYTLARFLPEYYKPSYYAAQAQFCHTSNGIFPHINPAELFIWMGVAQGISKLGLNQMDLAIRYMLVGLVMNFIGGWITDFTTAYVCKTSHIHLSKKADVEEEPDENGSEVKKA